MSAERRAAPRFACDVEARVEPGDGRSINAQTIDISYSGICVLAEGEVRPGTQVDFQLRLLFEWAESDTLRVPGTVVWSTPTQGGYQLGGRFATDVDGVTFTRLDVFLRFLRGELELPGREKPTT